MALVDENYTGLLKCVVDSLKILAVARWDASGGLESLNSAPAHTRFLSKIVGGPP